MSSKDTDPRLERALTLAFCPEAEVLARFLDERLSGRTADVVAEHVLACTDCSEVVTWTREAAQAEAKRKLTRSGKRRHLRARPRSNTPWAGIVAAAVVLLAGLLVLRSGSGPRKDVAKVTPTVNRVPQTTPTRAGSPKASPTAQPSAQPSQAPTPGPSATPGASPAPSPLPSPTTSPSPTPAPSATPGGGPTTVQSPTPVDQPADAVDAIQVASLSEGVRWTPPQGQPQALIGAALVPASTRLEATRPAGVAIGSRRGHLTPKAALRVEVGSIVLERGGILAEGAGRLDVGKAQVLTQVAATRVHVQRRSNDTSVAVLEGTAQVRLGDQEQTLKTGQALWIRGGRLALLVNTDSVLARAKSAADALDDAASLPVPRGLALVAGVRAIQRDLQSDDARRRARALRAGEALLAAPPVFAAGANVLQSDLRKVRDRFAAASPAALATQGTLSDVALAGVARLRGKRAKGPARARLLELADALVKVLSGQKVGEAGPVAEPLGPDRSNAWLAARALKRAARAPLPRDLFKRPATAATSPETALSAALLAPGRLSRRAQALLDQALAADPLKAPLTPARLWAIEQTLVLGNAWSAERARRLDAHLAVASQTDAVELAFLAGQHAQRLLGARPPVLEATLRVVPRASGYRVTIVLRSAQRGLREAWLCGSWDRWDESTNPMRRRPDGRFVVTLDLPSGRHEYKLRPASGDWELDADNPLSAPDEQGRVNSILLLP